MTDNEVKLETNIYVVALLREQLQEYYYTGVSHRRKSIVAVITQDRVIDDNLKKQIKNQTLYI